MLDQHVLSGVIEVPSHVEVTEGVSHLDILNSYLGRTHHLERDCLGQAWQTGQVGYSAHQRVPIGERIGFPKWNLLV
jgi:hypothetical protein